MTSKKAVIRAVGGYVPDYILTNQELEQMVDTNNDWILSRTGIAERRILKDPDKATSYMGVEAVKELLNNSDTAPEEIEMLICATVTPDTLIPDTANTICAKAGLTHAFAYDLNAACSGFIFALVTAAQYIETGRCKKVIVVGADKMSSVISYKDRSTCIIFGDGAGAVLLEAEEDATYGIQDSIMRGDGAGRENLYMKAGGSMHPTSQATLDANWHYVVQIGRPVFKSAVEGMSETVAEIMKKNNLSNDDVAWIVPHQANQRIISAVADRLDFPIEKVMVNIHKYGNTTAGTIPLCLWDFQDKFQRGDKVILTAFGGGYTWGAVLLTWM